MKLFIKYLTTYIYELHNFVMCRGFSSTSVHVHVHVIVCKHRYFCMGVVGEVGRMNVICSVLLFGLH